MDTTDNKQLTAEEFIKKWNVAFEDKEQKLEFDIEMQNDLNSVSELISAQQNAELIKAGNKMAEALKRYTPEKAREVISEWDKLNK